MANLIQIYPQICLSKPLLLYFQTSSCLMYLPQFFIPFLIPYYITSLQQQYIYLQKQYNILNPPSMQQLSKTEQIINRLNYRKHKQKLQQIKHNSQTSTSQQFYSSSIGKPTDRKKLYMIKIKREEIQQENQILRKKIQGINAQSTHESWRRKAISQNEYRKANQSMNHEANIKKNDRYDRVESDNKIEIISNCGQGQYVRCFVPTNKYKIKYASTSQGKPTDYNTVIENLRYRELNNKKKLINSFIQPKPQIQDNSKILLGQPEDKTQSNQLNSDEMKQQNQLPAIVGSIQHVQRLKQIIKQSNSNVSDNLQDALYNEPQKQAHRLILYKKTKIFYPMISFLIEISLIQDRLLITAYGMGMINEDYKLLISKKRSREIILETKDDYESLWNRINVQIGIGIKISGYNDLEEMRNSNEITSTEKEKVKQQKKFEITQDFLQRNYYTLLRESINLKNKEQKTTAEKNKTDIFKKQNNAEQKSAINKISPQKVYSYMRPTISSMPKENKEKQQGKLLGVRRKSDIKIENEGAKMDKNLQNLKISEKTKQIQEKRPKKLEPLKKVQNNIEQKGKSQTFENKITQNKSIESESKQIPRLNNKSSMSQRVNEKKSQKSHKEEEYQDEDVQNNEKNQQNEQEQDIYEDDYDEEGQNAQSFQNVSHAKSKQSEVSKKKQAVIDKSQPDSSQLVEDYAESFEQNNDIPDQQQYPIEFQSNPSKVTKNNSTSLANKKKILHNKSMGLNSAKDEIDQQFEKNASKNVGQSMVDQYLDEEFQT